MAGYPQGQPGYGYGAPPAQPYGATPYGAPPAQPYAPMATPYGAPSAPYAPALVPGDKPPKNKYQENGATPYSGYAPAVPPQSGYPQAGSPQPFANPFAALMPSAFPPGTDPTLVACFEMADQDRSGFIDDKELQRALSTQNQSFSLRTVHLLMYLFTNTNTRRIGPKEFTSVFYSLQNWRAIYQRFDRDQSGKIDASELREALMSLGFAVSPAVLDLLVSKFDRSVGKVKGNEYDKGKNKGNDYDMGKSTKGIEYDNFIECCLTVKGLTEKFKEKDTMFNGSAAFTYETFMLTVLPFLIA